MPTEWKQVILEGDITGSSPISVQSSSISLSVSGLPDAGTPENTDKILSWNGTQWETVDAEEFLGGGGTTTAAPTITGFASSYQQSASATGTISNFSSTASYVAKIFNSSNVEQTSNPVTIDGSGNISFTVPGTVANGYELRVYVADVGELKSTTTTITFAVTQSLSFAYWRLQVVDSSGSASSNRIALVELEYYTGQNQGGTETPTTNATSNTSISGVTIAAGHTYSSSYAPWRAFDGTLTGIGSAWWSIGTTAANNWIDLRFSSAQTFQSLKLVVNDSFNDATHFKILGSSNGNFSGEEVTALDTTAIGEGSGDTSTRTNF